MEYEPGDLAEWPELYNFCSRFALHTCHEIRLRTGMDPPLMPLWKKLQRRLYRKCKHLEEDAEINAMCNQIADEAVEKYMGQDAPADVHMIAD